jgi:hypothetical protein
MTRWRQLAPTADDPISEAGDIAPAATRTDTATTPSTEPSDGASTTPESPPTARPTPRSETSGSAPGSSDLADALLNSTTSGTRSGRSTRRWSQPKNVRAYAGQIRTVATLVLNGEMDLETVRLYSALSRSAAQMMNTEFQRARLLQAEPDLSFEDDE